MGGFSNWQMPANGDYRNLIDGASGDPLQWLRGQVKGPLLHELWWASDSIYFGPNANPREHLRPQEGRIGAIQLQRHSRGVLSRQQRLSRRIGAEAPCGS